MHRDQTPIMPQCILPTGSPRASALRETLVRILPEFTTSNDLRDYLSGWRDHEKFDPDAFAQRIARQRTCVRAACRVA